MDKITKFKKLIEEISSETGIVLPQGYQYRYAPYDCWKCEKQIIIFKWNDLLPPEENIKPPAPIPLTIRQRYTVMSGETYWANVCPVCDSVQGDFFLSCEPDSPFFTLGEIMNNKHAFNEDMKQIADYYYEQIVS